MSPIIVIGGGAAGIIAAWRAASCGAKVLLLERNKKLGVKLLISGGGKCNITHAGTMEHIRAAFVQREARFLKPSFYRFSNWDIVRMIEESGVKTMTRANGRVFPENGTADDVVNALGEYLRMSGVEVRLNARATGILAKNEMVVGLRLGNETIPGSQIILATGGASYPKTGTTGDGFLWAQQMGHAIEPIRAALAPISVEPKLPEDWRGIPLRDGNVTVFADGKKIQEWRGDILFSHEGITGPAALEVSRVAAEAMERHRVELFFDFFPTKDFPTLDEELAAFVLSKRDKMIGTLIEAWLPNRIVPHLLRSIDVDENKRGHVLTKDERRRIVGVLKSWKLGTVSRIDLTRGEVTAGGVALDEVDPQTMRSRKGKGLYICGEVLDVAGPVGGYNLQAAFSTGFVAGETAARDWLAENASTHIK